MPDLPRRWLVLLLCLCLTAGPLPAGTVTLKSGFQLEGLTAEVESVTAAGIDLGGNDIKIKEIYVVDDGMRRVFVPEKQVLNHVPRDDRLETIELEYNKPPPTGRHVASVGGILNVTPFNEFGRRVFTISGPQGSIDVIQGITKITSRYVQVEGLARTSNPYIWDMRVATSSIPREVLTSAIMKQIDPDDPDQRLKLFRLYTEAERYRDATIELERLVEDFPEMKRLGEHIQSLKQLRAGRLVKEIELLKDSGQHAYAYGLLNKFPDTGVAAETLLRVRDLLKDYETKIQQRQRILELLDEHLAGLSDAETKADVTPVVEEIKAELDVHTLGSMAAYLRLSSDTSLSTPQKLSLAVSGWLLGPDNASENMAVSAGLCRARPLVRTYLSSNLAHQREAALQRLRTVEGAGPGSLNAMLARIKPPQPLDGDRVRETGQLTYEVTAKGLPGEADVTYLVQLPPEYTPRRKYPCVLTLHGAGSTAEMQIDWWAGSPSKATGRRMGQATRRGYIVIAPKWTKEHQRKYEYSFREHAIALTSLRDALQRLSIDSDRVFLSGHSIGGDAAWDIGLAHPDLWAGVIPIVASAGKYVSRYWPNGEGLPMYFVTADMDAGRSAENAREWDRYLSKPGFDCIVVEYRGRGHEHFQDEVQHLFRWMNLQQRDFAPRSLELVSMRPWDNFFWFLELDGLPERSMVPPAAWPVPRASPAQIEATVHPNSHISLSRVRADKVTVYLTPDLVNMSEYQISLRGRRLARKEPDIGVMLEDARTRGDRQHPFWVKVTTP